MQRRRFLTLLGGALPALSSCSVLSKRDNPTSRPNIIFLLTDDQRDNSLGGMGHPWVKTPNLDTLMKNSVRFSNAYIAEPSCCPSRVSFFTGMHERVHGVGFTSSYKLNEEQWSKSYPALLRESGYYTGFIGKFGVEYYTFKGQAEKKFDFYRGHDGWAKFFPKSAANCKEYWDSAEDIITPVMGESIERFLNTAPKDKPFNLSVSFSIPHGSQIISMHKIKDHPVYGDLYRDVDIAIPEDTATDPHRYIPKKAMDQNKGRKQLYDYDYTTKRCREHHIRYYQLITGLDIVVGEMVASLKEKGLADNTVIIFASDHGLLMGEYGMGGKTLLYDLACKFPCFIYDPGLPKNTRGKTIDNLVSSLDITSTIVDYAGVEQPVEMKGNSLQPLLNGKSDGWRDEVFLENLYTDRDTPIAEGLRKGKWKYIRMYDDISPYSEKHLDFKNRKPLFEQLFDLSKDSEEKVNLIEKMEESAMLASLRKRCGELSEELNIQREKYRQSHEITNR